MMKQRLKFYTGLIGLIGVAVHTPSLAEHSLQVGLVTSANSSFYEDVGNEGYLLPLVIADYDRFYLQGISGGYRFYSDEAGQSLALEIRRTFDGFDSDDSDALAGMADRDAAWEAGLAYEVSMAGGQVKAKLMQDIADTHNGFSARFEYERPLWTDDAHMLSWHAGSEYWNSRKTDYYFGVAAEEAAPARSAYTADENYSFYIGSNLVKRIDDKITLLASAEYLRAGDAVNDSPITVRQDQWSAYVGVFYEF
ncbi:MAG: MipA/OmpV family protein [Candidatus Thiodiazotropha sp.]